MSEPGVDTGCGNALPTTCTFPLNRLATSANDSGTAVAKQPLLVSSNASQGFLDDSLPTTEHSWPLSHATSGARWEIKRPPPHPAHQTMPNTSNHRKEQRLVVLLDSIPQSYSQLSTALYLSALDHQVCELRDLPAYDQAVESTR
jgi:hypothetical protein